MVSIGSSLVSISHEPYSAALASTAFGQGEQRWTSSAEDASAMPKMPPWSTAVAT